MNNFRMVAQQVVRADRFATFPHNRLRFEEALQEWIRDHPGMNVEQYFVLLDLLVRLRPAAQSSPSSFSAFQYMIAKTLHESIQQDENSPYLRMARRFEKNRLEKGDKNAIISLNWDAAAERYFRDPFSWMSRQRVAAGRIPYRIKQPASEVDVIKLHGSLNWWICRACGNLDVVMDQRSAARKMDAALEGLIVGVGDKCGACGKTTSEPGFIPPTSQKLGTEGPWEFFVEMWREAQQRLLSCEHLNIVGYSFPPTDMQFQMLVRDSLKVASRLRTVTIVTNPKLGSQRLAFEDHMHGIFEDIAQVEIHYNGMEGWASATN
jgi:NAD-dependent SIR2 family protein deacetylase